MNTLTPNLTTLREELNALQQQFNTKQEELNAQGVKFNAQLNALQQQLNTKQEEFNTLDVKVNTQAGEPDMSKIVQLDTQTADSKNYESRIRDLLASDPDLSGREIARRIGCSIPTACSWKKLIEQERKKA